METKICKDCGQEKPVDDFPTVSTTTNGVKYTSRRHRCRKCHQTKFQDLRNADNRERYKALKEAGATVQELRRIKDPISYYVTTMLASAKARSKQKGLPCDLDREWIEKRILVGVCEVTGLPFDMANANRGDKSKSPWAPSCDRIDNSKGYTKDNVQVVVWLYNAAKGESNRDEFMTLVKALAKPLFKEAIESGRLKIAA